MEQYSKFGRTSEIYATLLTSLFFIRRFLCRNPRVLFPFFTVLSIWSFHVLQGLHRLEKYLNLEGFLEKSLKIKYALKSTGKSSKSLEKSLNSSIFYST